MMESYQPTPEEIKKAEESMSALQEELSRAREEGYALGVMDTGSQKGEKLSNPELLSQSVNIIVLENHTNTIKLRNSLFHSGILTIGQLREKTEVDILRLKNIGRTITNQLKKWMSTQGIKLKDNPYKKY